MAWWKGDDKSHGNPKLLAAKLDGTGLYFRAVSWCAAHESDGVIGHDAVLTLAPGVGGKALKTIIDRLTTTIPGAESPLWHVVPGGYRVNDYLDYNPSKEQAEAKRERERQRIANTRSSTGSVGGNTSTTGRQVDGVLIDPVPTRPSKDTPNPTAGAVGDSDSSPAKKLSPRAAGTNPRAVAAREAEAARPRLESQAAFAFGATRGAIGIHATEQDAYDEFVSRYPDNEDLRTAALNGWRSTSTTEGISA